jgi:hypothetical protein|tara:strand:- start:1682 stop:2071 length:390 start_codon:yes stop_codon:yes gene_type:complete
MANEGNLIPLNQRSKKERFVIQSKGGSVKSLRKSIGQEIRWAKKNGFTKHKVERLVRMMEKSECSSFQILKYLQTIEENLHPAQRIAYANSLMNWHKLVHGEKIKTENVHHIVDWTKMFDECEIEDDKV